MFTYWKVDFRLISEMLGTATEASIYDKHILQKAKKEIQKANKLSGKITKAVQKYKGQEIPEQKEVEELKSVIRAYQGVVGKITELPDSVEDLLEVAKLVKQEYEEMLEVKEEKQATVFLKDENGWPKISTHMVLGNIKENLRIMVNNGDESICKYKSKVGEMGALDIKWVDWFMKPSKDIIRNEKGERVLLERPLLKQGMGGKESVIALSEQLPAGTEFGTILRVRTTSPLNKEKTLKELFTLGRSNGFGAWRGSGNKGAYVFKLKQLEDYQEEIPEGWE